MALNVLRAEPILFTTIVQKVKYENSKFKNYNNFDCLLRILEVNDKLGKIVFDTAATEACRNTNMQYANLSA